MKKTIADVKAFDIDQILKEMVDKLPFLLQVIFFVSVKDWHETIPKEKLKQMLPKWTMVYGILMQCNFQELNHVQHVLTAALEDCMCEQKVSVSVQEQVGQR